MAALELFIYARSLAFEDPDPAVCDDVLDANRDGLLALSITGATAVTETQRLYLFEGPAASFDILMIVLAGCHEPDEFRVLHRCPISTREFESPPASRLGLRPAEMRWLDEELASGKPDTARLHALLSWAACRQADVIVSCQGEPAWTLSPQFPHLRLN